MKRIGLIIVIILLIASTALAKDESAAFDFVIGLTQQNMEMDWWFAIPSQFGPMVSKVESVSKGEYFNILPIFNNYGADKDGIAKITYMVLIIKPDNTRYQQIEDLNGYSGKITGPHLLPAKERLTVCFEPEDMFGEYIIKIEAFDWIKNQRVEKKVKINLKEFELPELNKGDMEWIFSYPSKPESRKAITAFLSPPRPYINKDGSIVWSALWFYKYVIEENDFLSPQIIEFFNKKATEQQKKDIILLFHLSNKTKELGLKEDLKQYRQGLNKIKIPDPYTEITTGDQLDMLWAEFFATGRVKPVRQIISSFKLSKFIGTLEKVKNKKLDINSDDVKQQAMLEAVFRSAMWSLGSNCFQSSLLFQYCVGLYQSDKLNVLEKKYLKAIIQQVSEEKNQKVQPTKAEPEISAVSAQ
ncbi:MAG: hypothetical protein KJ915_01975 [Candidatus Omnitrophica bacterium]|nr:hypothetical protein [Candidatus Omnitrophota bacterium]